MAVHYLQMDWGGGQYKVRDADREREKKEREGSACILSPSLDNCLCLPQTSPGTLNQGAGAWVFCVNLRMCGRNTRRGSCRLQHSVAAIRLKPCCCGAWLSSPLQGLTLTLKPLYTQPLPCTHETKAVKTPT